MPGDSNFVNDCTKISFQVLSWMIFFIEFDGNFETNKQLGVHRYGSQDTFLLPNKLLGLFLMRSAIVNLFHFGC